MASAPASNAFACGYDDPQSVSRGSLNWIYPNSLYVIGAISREVAARRLPLANFDQTGPDLFGHRFQLTKMALDQFGEMLRAASPEPSQTSISLVLVEPMLWTRFEPRADGLHARVHVAGAEPGDLVLVSGESVIGEIASGRLTVGDAGGRGLIRFYGSEAQTAMFIGTYRSIGSEPIPDVTADHARDLATGQSHQTSTVDATPTLATGPLSTPVVAASEVGGELSCGPGHH